MSPALAPVASPESALVRSFLRLLALAFLGCCLIPIVLLFHGRTVLSPGFLTEIAVLTAAALFAVWAFDRLLKRIAPAVDAAAAGQADFLDHIHARYVDWAILAAAALSLFLELAVIRWQSTVFEFFAFYKNFSLLACFVGLGLGYALAARDRIPLLLSIPLMAVQFVFMISVRYGSNDNTFRILPFREQLNMGVEAAEISRVAALYSLLTIVFLITALTFIPIGQLCGRLMERRTKLRAYGMNLAGSLAGVILVILVSFLWTPPLVWFALCFLAILLFHVRKTPVLLAETGAAMICCVALAWPVTPLWNRIYSPYQLLEIGNGDDTGLPTVRAAGHYYQNIYDFSGEKPRAVEVRDYYDFPYKAHPHFADVAIVGAGTGNDVAAALRAGAGYVDAIEIDPAILMTGKASHPEKPYKDPRVHAQINDARSFLRTTGHRYDLIVYGLLDSHTLLSQGSSVRLDSFVYTIEGLREARGRLKPDGVISLAFSVLNDALGRKIYLMMQQAFDGQPPVCVSVGRNRTIFLESNDKSWRLSPAVAGEAGFADNAARYGNPTLHADISTDDWPFFYMPRRVYPTSYLVMVFQIILLSVFITGNFVAERPEFSSLSFFFLGAGFMLVETKGITEMGLTFGNTWQVIGIVIASILIMAWLGNCMVAWLKIRRPLAPFVLLWAALAAGWYVARSGGFPSTPGGRVETAIVLTCPLFFSGIVFSTLLSSSGSLSSMMAMNILGAICGGLLEYNSMYFGFRALYLLAAGCYVLAFAADLLFRRPGKVRGCVAPNSRASIG